MSIKTKVRSDEKLECPNCHGKVVYRVVWDPYRMSEPRYELEHDFESKEILEDHEACCPICERKAELCEYYDASGVPLGERSSSS